MLKEQQKKLNLTCKIYLSLEQKPSKVKERKNDSNRSGAKKFSLKKIKCQN